MSIISMLVLQTVPVDRLLPVQELREVCVHVVWAGILFFGDFFFPSKSDSWRALLMAASS